MLKQFLYSLVANFLKSKCVKNYENWLMICPSYPTGLLVSSSSSTYPYKNSRQLGQLTCSIKKTVKHIYNMDLDGLVSTFTQESSQFFVASTFTCQFVA